MPRVRRCSYPLTVLPCFLILTLWTLSVYSDCWYDFENHVEGSEVATVEPCLNCTCSKGALLCYLRICPRLPNPPPSGCVLKHKYKHCCSELICPEFYFGGNTNGIEARSDPEDHLEFTSSYEKPSVDACVVNGSVYGPGSAMYSSSLCEYCYCLGGKQTCVKPKCLLPVDGCVPMYEPTNCCPVSYNCTISTEITSTSSTTTRPKDQIKSGEGGCIVDGVYYNEGERVLGISRSICDNCYCLRGVLRCEPLSCAPPLLGCSPIVRAGECCAASYNCSGTIEIQPEPHYGEYPVVSKEYAKLRKEIHKVPLITEKSTGPFYVIADSSSAKISRSTASFGTTRHFTDFQSRSSTVRPQYYFEIEDNNERQTTKTNSFYPGAATQKPSVLPTENGEKIRSDDYLGLSDDTLLSIVDSLLDTRLNRRIESSTDNPEAVDSTSTLNNLDLEESTTIFTTEDPDSTTTDEISTTDPAPVTFKTVLNSTDCVDENGNTIERRDDELEASTLLPVDANEINKLEEVQDIDESITSVSSEYPITETTSYYDLESRSKFTTSSTAEDSFEIKSILKDKENDYEFDYNEPSLPPSLPNLKIIPFVAADALDADKEKPSPVYAKHGQDTDTYGYSNLFSPPIETEGGFIPKEPPILPNFYENAVTSQSSLHREDNNCIDEDGRNIPHGNKVPPTSPCVECLCIYGKITCQKIACPNNVNPECMKDPNQDDTFCCPRYICDDDHHEAPIVVLEGASPHEMVTVAEGVITDDPFKHVIRTEPAPNLQSLIVDLNRKSTVIPIAGEAQNQSTVTTTESVFSLDRVLQFFFSNGENGDKAETGHSPKPILRLENSTTTSTTTESVLQNRESTNHLNSVVDEGGNEGAASSSLGLLKLAGCNIYGRMYRVGRIISELSNPCLECKCTEVGVYCRSLKC